MRFVSPETVRIPLGKNTDGVDEWIEVKKELTVGEDTAFRSAGFKDGVDANGRPLPDWFKLSFARVEAYLLDWSEKVKVTPQAIKNLAREDFERINDAIQAHMERMAQEKKVTTGSTPSMPDSPSAE